MLHPLTPSSASQQITQRIAFRSPAPRGRNSRSGVLRVRSKLLPGLCPLIFWSALVGWATDEGAQLHRRALEPARAVGVYPRPPDSDIVRTAAFDQLGGVSALLTANLEDTARLRADTLVTEEHRQRALERSPGNTPVVPLGLVVGGRRVTFHLKIEAANPTGSIKDRTAWSILTDLRDRGALRSDSIIVDSSSGTFGAALGYAGLRLGYDVSIVVDPNLSPELDLKLIECGVVPERVRRPDANGNYLASRLARVKELCALSDRYVWANQYGNEAAPRAHIVGTGPEMFAQMDGSIDAVFVAVSTCGTLSGLARYIRQSLPETQIIAVDAVGSVVLGGPPGQRLLTGIGSHRSPDFPLDGLVDGRAYVTDRDAFWTCWAVHRTVGLHLGGSSGAVLHAAAQYAAERDIGRVVCVCPDTGRNYLSTFYSPRWLRSRGMLLAGDLMGRAPFEGTPAPIDAIESAGAPVDVSV